jgi:diguanylate cyclase
MRSGPRLFRQSGEAQVPQDDFLSATKELAGRALERMRALGLPENSQNFHVWYTYFSGESADLVAEIDALLAGGGTLDDRACETLFAKYFSAENQENAAHEACGRLDALLAELRDEISQTQDVLGAYGARLREACAAPDRAADPDAAVQSVLAAASGMVDTGEGLRETVARAGAKLKSIRESLQAAYVESGFDALTKVANWKSFYGTLRRFAAQATEQRLPLALLIVDINDLAGFNRRHGRANGDLLLKMIAAQIRDSVGESGFIARYAGDAFGVVLPQIERADAVALGEKIRADFSGRPIVNKVTGRGLGTVELSIGVASYEDGESLALFVHRCLTSLAKMRSAATAAGATG